MIREEMSYINKTREAIGLLKLTKAPGYDRKTADMVHPVDEQLTNPSDNRW